MSTPRLEMARIAKCIPLGKPRPLSRSSFFFNLRMKLKTLLNGAILLSGLGLIAYSFLVKGLRVRFNVETVPVDSIAEAEDEGVIPEVWQVKEGSIYDGDTLRLVKGSEELKIRFCGIDAPERGQELGIESRDHLRSLVELGNGELLLLPIEQDRYGRTVAEVI